MRVEYVGKSVDEIGVSVAGEPPIKCGFKYGERFRKQAEDRFLIENIVGVDPDREENADVLWLPPSEFDDDDDEILVAVVDERCLQNDRLLEWLKRELTLTPDSPSFARVFVPESRLGSTSVSRMMNKRLSRNSIEAAAFSYYPTLVD
ncbi:hypothetical protein GCM10022381_12770 [Leifsonia kafniensis]|uniref:AMP-binding enzyme C-terminal domain-containing protein n=1 Tax=Leifsonia kafniensis TaxID=475957 RepID=A0ABP7KC31_9MICO